MLGVFWRGASAGGALVTLWAGSAMGLVVFLLDWFKDITGWSVPSMMTTFYLFVICSVVLVVVSKVRPHEHTEESLRLVWGNPLDALRGRAWRGLGNYRLLSALLFATMITLYTVFR